MSRKPFAFVTSAGRVVRKSVVDDYVMKDGESRQVPEDQFTQSYGDKGLKQPLYNPSALAHLLEINTYHYRACKTKARDIAGLGWTLSPTVAGNESEAERELVEDWVNSQYPSVTTTLDRVQMDIESIGWGAMELVYDQYDSEKELLSLHHLPSHTTRLHGDGMRAVQIRGTKRVWFKREGVQDHIHKDTGEMGPNIPEGSRGSVMLVIPNYTPRSDFYGLPDIIPAIRAIYGDISRAEYNIAFFDNFGVPAYAVFISGDFDEGPEDEETGQTPLEETIEEHFREMNKNPHSILVMSVPSSAGGDVDIKFEPLSVDTKEASFRLYRKDNRDEILAAHGIPPYRMGIAETGSLGGSTAEESTEIYKRSVIEPRQDRLEELINKYIVRESLGVEDWEFELAEIDTTDESHEMDLASNLFSRGAMTPNDLIRNFGERFGLEEIDHPAMDAHYVNNLPIDLEQQQQSAEVDAALMGLEVAMLEVVTKHESGDGNGSTNPEIADLLRAIKKSIPDVAGSGRA